MAAGGGVKRWRECESESESESDMLATELRVKV